MKSTTIGRNEETCIVTYGTNQIYYFNNNEMKQR